MNIFLGIILLAVTIGLFSILIYLFGKKPHVEKIFLIHADVTTEDSKHLVRIIPIKQDELPGLVFDPLHMDEHMKQGLTNAVSQILNATVLDPQAGPLDCPAFHVIVFKEVMDRLRRGSHVLSASKEILVTKRMNDSTQQAEENVQLTENLLPPALGLLLWRVLVVDRAREFLAGLGRTTAVQELILSDAKEEDVSFPDEKNAEKQRQNREYVRRFLTRLRKESVPETEELRQNMERVEREQLETLQAINRRAKAIRDEIPMPSSDDYKEDAVLKVMVRYGEAFLAYLEVIETRVMAALLCVMTPVDFISAKHRVELCRRILEEESGQITMLLKIMDSADADQFITLTSEDPSPEETVVFSLHYPSYLMQELLAWYKKHRVTERLNTIRGRLQPQFGEIETRINELLKMAADGATFVESPPKEEVSLLAILDGRGMVTAVERTSEGRKGAPAKKIPPKKTAKPPAKKAEK